MSTEQAPSTGPSRSGSPGRYQRSAAGLVISLVVTVAAIGALLYFMGVFRPDFETKPTAIDYLETVEGMQLADQEPVYPAELPEGWIATSVNVPTDKAPYFMVGMLTDDNRFVAVRQEDTSFGAMLSASVDKETTPTDDYTVPADVRRPVAREWEGHTDEGGDTAYLAEVGEQSVMVYGSAPAKDLRAIIDSLTVAELR
ncbi:uncharacterized protein DUF4245 [Nocardioides sp. J9]|uniref:DUF4245 domain-containing protein n=1 Tax=unclassified Nocardioides TaxID=2615069 RepID=UPI00048E0D75|nr:MULTISPECIES: DUF4245 domain-containing protein [unclassified Nocardioides]TWG99403.1 uncharacterized protein DUF4245 [Nocardioides sp. J9]